ncbi:MAG: SDR family NAD(P)-dependent oxidoreductase [Fluviicola sp.]
MKLSNNTTDRLKNKYGKWVLITGATSGIGREMAILLGNAGFNLVITGRREQELEGLSSQLFEANKIEVIPMPGDLSIREDVDELLSQTAHLPLGIVILNAGYGTSGKFGATSIDQEVNMLRLNAESLMISAHHFINLIQEQRRTGAIVFLSSMVAFQGVPYTAHYAATKAYVQSLGEALGVELKGSGIDVLNAAPGPVNTGFSSRANLKMKNAAHPEKIAFNIIKAIGRKRTVFPDGMTKFLVYSLGMLPRGLKTKVMGSVMKGFTEHQKSK